MRIFFSVLATPLILNHFLTTKIQTEFVPIPDFLIKCICLVDINMFARFDEIPAMALEDIKETRCYGGTDRQTYAQTQAHTHKQRENSIPSQRQFPWAN